MEKGWGAQRRTLVRESQARVLTLRDLRGQRRGDGDKVALPAAVVHGHLAALAQVTDVAVALGHEQLQGVVPVHEHTWGERAPREPVAGVQGQTAPWVSRGEAPGTRPPCPCGSHKGTGLEQGRQIQRLTGTRQGGRPETCPEREAPVPNTQLLLGMAVGRLFKRRQNLARFFFFFLMRNYLMLMFQLMQLLQQSSYKPNKTTGRQLTTSDRDRQYPNLLTAVKSFLQTKPHHHMEPRWVKGALPAGSEDRRGLRWSQDEQRPAPGRLKRGTIVTPTPEGQRWGFEDTRGSI